MSATPQSFRPFPAVEGWRSLQLLALYRWVVAVFLVATYFSGRADDIYGDELQAGLFLTASAAYLALCLPISLLALLKKPGLRWQLYGNAVLDVLALAMLMYAAGGVSTGLGMLLIVFIAGTSMLLPRRQGLLIGALATLALLGEEALRALNFDAGVAGFVQAGMLGMLYLFTAWVANTLAVRASTGEALAARRKLDLDNLAQINERIIAHMQVGVLVVDSDARIRLLNQAACQLLDIRPSATGKLLAAEMPALSASLEQWRRRTQSESEPVSLEVEDRVLLAHFNRLTAVGDLPALVFLEDANRASEQAQQMKLAALGRLTASIAHEIRNPLSAISHASQLLTENDSAQSQEQKLLEIINRHTARINTIVQKMLGLSRRDQTVPQTLMLRPWLEKQAHEYREALPGIAPRIDLEMVSPKVEVRADPGQLAQVLRNIWDNAVTHSGLPPEQLVVQLNVDYWAETGRVFLDIYDNGRGIAPDVAAEIFEPFFTTRHSGTGLGLYIARELCECNHAKLSLVHGSTLGTCFRIVFANPAEWLEQDTIRARSTAA